MMQFLKNAIFILPWCMTGTSLSGFSFQKPAKQRQHNRRTIPVHWPTSPAVTFIVNPDPGFGVHRCRQIALGLAAMDATLAANDNETSIDPEDEEIIDPDSYDSAYRKITDLLKTYDYILVGGPESIGNSLFYLYFFQHYRKDFPNKGLVTASFTQTRRLVDCMLYYQFDCERYKFIPVRDEGPADFNCDLYLYDGPPDKQPPPGVKMIAFTDHNLSWLDPIDTGKTHTRVYLPEWWHEPYLKVLELLNLEIRSKFDKPFFWIREERE